MYVTDTPVIDRLTDPAWRELDSLQDMAEVEFTNLIITAEDVPAVVEHAQGCGEDCADLAAHLEGLSEAVDRAYSARNALTDHLTYLKNQSL